MLSAANHPVAVGIRWLVVSGLANIKPTPGAPNMYFKTPPTKKSVLSFDKSIGIAPTA